MAMANKRRRVVNMHAAKSQLSKLVEEAREGREVVIARDGEPVAILAPIGVGPRQPGGLPALVVGNDFFDALPPDIRRGFGDE